MIAQKINEISHHMIDRESRYAEAYSKLQQRTKLLEKEKEYLSLKLRQTLQDARQQQIYYRDVEEKLSLVMRLLEDRERNATESVASLESDLLNSKQREYDLRSEVQHLHVTISDLRSSIASSMTPLAVHEQLQSKYETLQQTIGEAYVSKEEYQMLHTAYESLLHRMETTMVMRGEYDALMSKYNQKLIQIESDTIDRAKYDDLQQRYDQLKEHIAKNMAPVSECNRFREEAEKFLRQNELFEESFSILEEDKRIALQKVQKCEQKINSLKSRIQLANEEKESLETKLEQRGATICTLETEMSQLSTLLSDEREYKNKLLVENAAQAIRIAELQRSFQRSIEMARHAPVVKIPELLASQEEEVMCKEILNSSTHILNEGHDDLQACEAGLKRFHEKLKDSVF